MLELRLRDDILLTENGRERRIPHGEYVKVRVLEPEDVVVPYVVGLTIEQGGLLRLHEPDRFGDISDVPASLRRLRRNGLIEASAMETHGASRGESARSRSRRRQVST